MITMPHISTYELPEPDKLIADQITRAFEQPSILPIIQERLSAHRRIILPANEFLSVLETEARELLFQDNPKFVKLCNIVIRDHFFSHLNGTLEEQKDFTIPIRLRGWTGPRPINSIRTEDLNQFGVYIGQIMYHTDTIPVITKFSTPCARCGTILKINVFQGNMPRTIQCACRNKINVISPETKPERENTVRIMVEPLPDASHNTGGTVLVVLREDMCKTNVLRMLEAGSKIVVSGIVNANLPKSADDEPMFFIDANYIENVDKTNDNLTVTEEDRAEFRKLQEKPDLIEYIAKDIFDPFVLRSDAVKQAIVLSIVGATQRSLGKSNINIFMVGDPSTAKSYFLRLIKDMKLHPITRYVSGVASSVVGLIGGAVKDPLLDRFVACPGAFALANNGLCLIDEFDKFPKDDQVKLNEALENGEIELTKIVKARFKTNAAVILNCNPLGGGRFDKMKDIAPQIGAAAALISRFDLVFIFEHPKGKEREEVARVMAKRHGSGDEQLFTPEQQQKHTFYRKFFLEARKIRSFMPPEIQALAGEFDTRLSLMENADTGHAITLRYAAALCRIAEARARLYFRQEVNRDDLEIAFKLLTDTLLKLGHNPLTGEFSLSNIETGRTATSRNKMNALIDIFYQYGRNKAIKISDLWMVVAERIPGWSYFDFETTLVKLQRDGMIMNPHPDEAMLL